MRPADEVQQIVSTGPTEHFIYKVEQQCKRSGKGEVCSNPRRCVSSEGAKGTWFSLLRRSESGGPWTDQGLTCLTADEAGDLGVITPAMVAHEMRRLSWPRPELTIQPPDGQTLVDFDTNFLTTTTSATTQTVTLLGQRVTIEARPSAYVWHHGDDTSAQTQSPGHRYPHTDVTYSYEEPGHLRPSVDVVYSGRYRVNDGGWQTIPGTLTVQGESVPLWVRTASPRLTG